jgi:hypothetical protein
MKLAARKPVNHGEQRRVRLLSERARSASVRETFPHVGAIRIELRFDDRSENVLSPQLHTLYPAARAFFRFACPCAECDGDFDLAPIVHALLDDADRAAAGRDLSVRGRVSCQGIRARDRANGRPCPVELSYRLTASAPAPAD